MTQIILRKWFTHCNSRVSKGGAGDYGVEACCFVFEWRRRRKIIFCEIQIAANVKERDY
jgi:hypothetical protein